MMTRYKIGQTACVYLASGVLKGVVKSVTSDKLLLSACVFYDGSLHDLGEKEVSVNELVAHAYYDSEKGKALHDLSVDMNFLPPAEKDPYEHLRAVAEKMKKRNI